MPFVVLRSRLKVARSSAGMSKKGPDSSNIPLETQDDIKALEGFGSDNGMIIEAFLFTGDNVALGRAGGSTTL